MPNIPTVPGSEMDIHTPQQAVHLNAGGLNQRLAGDRAIAGAVQDVGEEAARIDHDIQNARRVRIASEVDLKMRAARQTFIETLKNDQDETAWEGRAKEVTDGVRQDLFANEKQVPPGMRAEVDAHFKDWSQTLLIETKGLARVQAVNRSWGKVKEDFNEKLADGDAAGALTNLKTARNLGLADAEEIDKLERGIPRQIAQNYIETGLAMNPKGTYDLLVSGATLPATDAAGKPINPRKEIDPKDFQVLLNTARVRTEAWQKENFADLVGNQADVNGYVPESSITAKIDAGEIDARTGRNLIAAQDKRLKVETARTAMSSFETLTARIHDPTEWGVLSDDAKRLTEDAAKIEDPELRQRAVSDVNRQLAAKTAAAERSLVAEDKDRYALLVARTHDSTAWGAAPDAYAKDLIADAAEITDPALRQRAINDANHQLAAVKRNGEVAQRPVEQQMYELIRSDKSTNGAMLPVSVEDVPEITKRAGILYGGGRIFSREGTPGTTRYVAVPGGLQALSKLSDDEIQLKYGAPREAVVAAAELHSARVEEKMRQWFNTPEGVKATFEQANNHRMEIERPYVMDSVKNALAKKAPAAVTTEAEFNALPSGAPFTWNGRAGIKN